MTRDNMQSIELGRDKWRPELHAVTFTMAGGLRSTVISLTDDDLRTLRAVLAEDDAKGASNKRLRAALERVQFLADEAMVAAHALGNDNQNLSDIVSITEGALGQIDPEPEFDTDITEANA